MLRLVRPGEGSFVLWIASLALVCAFGRVILLSVANSRFLARFDAGDYGWVYLLTGVLLATLGAGYRSLVPRLSFDRLGSVALWAMAMGVLVQTLLLETTEALLPLLAAWVLVVWVFGLLVLWGLASRGLDREQAGRLFGLMGVGEVLGDVVGGLSVGAIGRALGTRGSLLVAAGALALGAVLVLVIARRFPRVREAQARPLAASEAPTTLGPWQSYVRWVCLLCALITLCWYLVDVSVYRQLQANFRGEAELRTFLGRMWAGVAAATFTARLVFAGPVLSRFGVRAILALPLVVGSLLGVVAASAALGWTQLTLLATVATLAAWRVLRDGIDKPATLLLYQALPAQPRLSAQSFVETLSDGGATALAGVLLLVLGAAPWFGASSLALLTGAIVLGWAFVARRLIALHGALPAEETER